MIVFVLCVFGYFLGFLSNLFKALDSKPFIVPQADIASAYRGLTDWEHLRYALAAVGVILLVVLFFVVKSKIESRNQFLNRHNEDCMKNEKKQSVGAN